LARDPFADAASPYVPLPSHDEAVARLVHVIESAQPRACFSAAAGLGKTTVLRKAFAETKSPRRRFVAVGSLRDPSQLWKLLAERLGARFGREGGRADAWNALERALRVLSLEGFQVVFAVDDCRMPRRNRGARLIDSLGQLATRPDIELTIIRLDRGDRPHPSDASGPCGLAITLLPLTRSEAQRYLTAKLAAAGCCAPVFTPRAVTRLHGLSTGIPRSLERLAALTLIAGASSGLNGIGPDLVDRAALECRDLAPRLLPCG
jgi:type II secretory pathway predicted ATPase ExeA